MLKKNDAIQLLNELGESRTPFSFYCDFLGDNWCIQLESSEKLFQLEIDSMSVTPNQPVQFKKEPVGLTKFNQAFDSILKEIRIGNSFLVNLTFETPIVTNLSLSEIFSFTQAKYKVLAPDQFVVFSPETFIKTNNNSIFTFPMKGTIDASLPNAEETLLNDQKEIAEHVTIVDLLRNDLSQVATQVHVNRFRFIDKIQTLDRQLLQVSSEIEGKLPHRWQDQLGTLLSRLLPAGSISGAPKPETIRIIEQVEDYSRKFYTGICGQFDGKNLDTGVMIRFIKKVNDQLFFCSGGGVTSFSQAEKEYQEMIDKVNLPVVST